mmetsp:Transcript_10469/g.34737  ORF Transcript_10469/g.34737 Transcript_10469/m.34737 type:complete len:222 (-) Transcript_10469:109-774(-)
MHTRALPSHAHLRLPPACSVRVPFRRTRTIPEGGGEGDRAAGDRPIPEGGGLGEQALGDGRELVVLVHGEVGRRAHLAQANLGGGGGADEAGDQAEEAEKVGRHQPWRAQQGRARRLARRHVVAPHCDQSHGAEGDGHPHPAAEAAAGAREAERLGHALVRHHCRRDQLQRQRARAKEDHDQHERGQRKPHRANERQHGGFGGREAGDDALGRHNVDEPGH